MRRVLLFFILVLTPSACYHATINTGLRPSSVTLEEKWASSWIYGLVPPATVEAAERCTAGVARVETQLSFANQLVGILSFGIYTPMELIVTCADDRDEDLQEAKTPEEADRLLRSGDPFLISLY